MKFSATLSLIAIAAAASSMQAASAQESRGARFNYAPNVWKTEAARVPKGYGQYAEPQHNVQAGAVPSNNVLGLDPTMLAKPLAPVAQVASHPATTSLTPSWSTPRTNASFQPAFGKPQGIVAQSLPPALHAPVMPTRPQSIVPATSKPVVAASAPAARGQHHSGNHAAVSGRVMPFRPRNVTPVAATPAVASYDKGFGYLPGAYLPSSSGSATQSLSGKLLTDPRHKKNH